MDMSPKTKEYITLAVILLTALAVRLIFLSDLVRGDALNYAHAAYELSEGRLSFDAWAGVSRIGLYGPVALLYFLFGPSQLTTLFFPVASSLLTVMFVFAIGRMFGGVIAGLIAALIWTFLSLDVHLASILLPDGPLTTFSTGAVYFLFLWDRSARGKRWIFLAISVAMLIWALLIKPLAIITMFFFFIFIVSGVWGNLVARQQKSAARITRLTQWNYFVPALIIILFIGLIIYASVQPRPFIVSLSRTANDFVGFLFLGATELDFSNIRFSQSILFVFLAPLFLVAVCFSLVRRRLEFKWLFVWIAVLVLYYEWGSINENPLVYIPIEAFNEARNFLFVLPPLVIVAALYLSETPDAKRATWIIPGIALSVTGLAWLTKPDLYGGNIPIWIEISSGLLLLGAVISPLFVLRKETKYHTVFVVVFLLLISSASLKPILPYHALMYIDRQQILANARSSYVFWNKNIGQIIYARDRGLAMTLNYAGDFQLGYDWAEIGLDHSAARIHAEDPEAGQEGFIVLTGKVDIVPSGWIFETAFGSDPRTSISIFRLTFTHP